MGQIIENVFGVCPICGGRGGDDPDAGGADAPARDTTGNGLPLFLYQGVYMCELCIANKKADVASAIEAQRHAMEDSFRRNAGYAKNAT